MTMTSTIRRVLLALLIAVGAIVPAVTTTTPVSADVYLGSPSDATLCDGTVAGFHLPSLYTRVCFDNTTRWGPEIFTYNANNQYTYYHVVTDYSPVFSPPPSVSTNSPIDSFRVTTVAWPMETIAAGGTWITQDMSWCNPNDGVYYNLICVNANLYQILKGMANDQSYEFSVTN